MKQKFKPETWVGLFLIAGLLMLLGVILGFGDLRSSEERTYPLNIIFKNADGLIKDAPVRLSGITVGKVATAPRFLPSGNGVMLEISVQHSVKIQVGSTFRITPQNLVMDNKCIDIVPPNPPTDQYLSSGDKIMGEAESDLSKIKNNAVVASEEIITILKRLEQNSGNIDETLINISKAAQGLTETTRIINEQLLDEQNLKSVKNFLANMDQAGKDMPAVMEQARKATTAINDTVRDVRLMIAGAGDRFAKLDPAIKEIPSTLQALRKASDNIAAVTADTRKNQGFLGLLLYDARFRTNAQEFIRNLRDYGILRYRNPGEPEAKPDPRSGFSGSRR